MAFQSHLREFSVDMQQYHTSSEFWVGKPLPKEEVLPTQLPPQTQQFNKFVIRINFSMCKNSVLAVGKHKHLL